jgi:RNA polymerase sigma-70 factor (ECF subfamily)
MDPVALAGRGVDQRGPDGVADGDRRATARAELVAAVDGARRRDPAAIDELVRRLAADLEPVCGGIALDDGDDALQETLLQVLRSLDQLRDPAAVGGWARRIAVRESVRVAHRRARIAPLGAADVADAPVARGTADGARGGLGAANTSEVLDELAANADRRLDVVATLRELDPDQRAVLVLRHLHGLEEQEVADMLDVPVGTVKSRASRARQAFARRWRP